MYNNNRNSVGGENNWSLSNNKYVTSKTYLIYK
jgi:hypothetical protein